MEIWDTAFEKFWQDNGLALGSRHDAEYAFQAGWAAAVEAIMEKMEARNG